MSYIDSKIEGALLEFNESKKYLITCFCEKHGFDLEVKNMSSCYRFIDNENKKFYFTFSQILFDLKSKQKARRIIDWFNSLKKSNKSIGVFISYEEYCLNKEKYERDKKEI